MAIRPVRARVYAEEVQGGNEEESTTGAEKDPGTTEEADTDTNIDQEERPRTSRECRRQNTRHLSRTRDSVSSNCVTDAGNSQGSLHCAGTFSFLLRRKEMTDAGNP